MAEPVTDREIAAATFSVFAEHVRQHGKPYPGGEFLRESLHTASLVCEECGPLPLDQIGTDWLTLCHDAMDHVKETAHRVAVQATQEAIYGPKESEGA